MKAILFLQGSHGALNCRDARPLFMETVRGRPLLDVLLSEATASGVFDRTVFVTSADGRDDAVAGFLSETWPSVEVIRIEAGSPHAFGPASRRERPLTVENHAGILSVDGFNTIAARFVRDSSQGVFVLDVNDAPLCSQRFFLRALPLAREAGFCGPIAPGTTSLCGFQMRHFEKMAGHQRSLRVAEAATVRERVERLIQEVRRERYLDSDEQIETLHAWQRMRADSYLPRQGGSLQDTVRDYAVRHTEGGVRERFAHETRGEAIAVTTRTALAMVRAALETPGAGDLDAAEQWLLGFEERLQHREGQTRFWPDCPSYLEVELTSRCNLACRFCPQTKLSRPKGDLQYETLEALLDRVGDFVTLLNFSGFGEPTLHARLFDCVRLAKAKGIPRVEIETNGTTIDEAFLDDVFASGLDVLSVNLDAFDEGGNPAFNSVYELVKRLIERRGGATRPFIVLQRVNMAVAGQDAKIQRDFALWYDVADAFVIKPFNPYRGTFPDKRVINFAPLDRGACRKVLASALVLSTGQAVMCEQCFDGENADGHELLGASGESLFLRALRVRQARGELGDFCSSCSQWYQQDVAWTMPGASHSWFDTAVASSARRLAGGLLARHGASLTQTGIPRIIVRSGDYGDELQRAYSGALGRTHGTEVRPAVVPAAAGRIGVNDSAPGRLVRPASCTVSDGKLYVTDPGAERVAVFSLDGTFETSFGPITGAEARNHELPDIAGLDGELLVADTARLSRFALDGQLLGALAPNLGGASVFSIAAGGPGRLWISTDRGRVVLLDLASGNLGRTLDDPAWCKVVVSSSIETDELFVANVTQHELLVYSLDGKLLRHIDRRQLARLNWPVRVTRWLDGYAVSNTGGKEILILSSSFEYQGAVAAPDWTGAVVASAERLYAITRGTDAACCLWQLQSVPAEASAR